MDTSGIGRRIAYWRGRRRMTQAEFGALMGKSRHWVQDIELGHRQSDPRLSVLERAAEALTWHAADRAVMAAERSGDAIAIAGAARHLCDAMFHRGNCREAVDFATATAARHERDLVRSSQG
jgi:transcriptional regulator with XRE-family HTH domain